MMQLVKALSIKPHNLSSIPAKYMVEGDYLLLQAIL